MLDFLKTYKHAALLLYYLVILIQFQWLEKINATVPLWIKSPLDDYIPFVSAFVIPYIAWFWFIAATLVVLCFKDKSTFIRLCMALYVGMTICYVIYYFIPNGQQLRAPLTSHETGFFDRMVYHIYANDTPTNSAPSIHVINSVFTTYAVMRSPFFRNKLWLRVGAQVLNILIILSTMFIKQHSIVDVVLGLILAGVLIPVIFHVDWGRLLRRREEPAGAVL